MTKKKPYEVPTVGMEYNEFAGSLGPYGNGNPVNTELHVRYGVRGGKYYDWTIELIAREGDVDSFRATGERPVRYVMDSFSVEQGAVVHRVRTGPGPDDFETSVVRQLYVGDGDLVDSGYTFLHEAARRPVGRSTRDAGPAHDRHVRVRATQSQTRVPRRGVSVGAQHCDVYRR